MGLIASIFAYLGTVTVLVVTLSMSFGAFLYPLDQTTIAQQTIATAAKPRAAQPASVSPASNERSGSPGVTQTAGNEPNGDGVSRQPHVRRLVRQVRAKDWLHQQEPKVFGYAEEPSASFLYDRFQ
ncbi:MAG: hypothetical protein WB760_16985 [Xanthobacteraceae bacterium]